MADATIYMHIYAYYAGLQNTWVFKGPAAYPCRARGWVPDIGSLGAVSYRLWQPLHIYIWAGGPIFKSVHLPLSVKIWDKYWIFCYLRSLSRAPPVKISYIPPKDKI